ncbi:hypothetical protein FSW04_20955 [Baekduia soli]|uniref:Asl1-like glycosyl hydrolase catalytic domain-containing protein n=1 Tax=Baekduia soli TaxID=496014 RepID=A0A5B8UA00_9ACTN|nr:hypothetical protein [Baekduia soli]QEC49794.1 hypothetical protein FSW04_20955 [Baekduia soli]
MAVTQGRPSRGSRGRTPRRCPAPIGVTAVVALALALAAVAARPARAEPVVGIGEANPAAFADPRFLALGLHAARLVVPYDAVVRGGWERDAVDAWMAAAAAHGLEPSVAFEHSRHPGTAPSVAAYGAALAAFHGRYPQVGIVTPWNEPNHVSQPTWDDPALAAAYYDEARRVLPDARLVAGDVLDIPGALDWLRAYRAHLGTDPRLWGIHDYGDATDLTDPLQSTTAALLSAVPGELWVTETGGIVRFWPFLDVDLARAARSTAHAFVLARMSPRITRMYLYNWYGPVPSAPGSWWDTGLVGADGTPRPALDVVRRELAVPRAAPGPASNRVAPADLAGTGCAGQARVVDGPGETVLSAGCRARLRLSARRRGTRTFHLLLVRTAAGRGHLTLQVSGSGVRRVTRTTSASRQRLTVRIPRGRARLRVTATFDGTAGWADARLPQRTLRLPVHRRPGR